MIWKNREDIIIIEEIRGTSIEPTAINVLIISIMTFYADTWKMLGWNGRIPQKEHITKNWLKNVKKNSFISSN